jgi:hypothetical protein
LTPKNLSNAAGEVGHVSFLPLGPVQLAVEIVLFAQVLERDLNALVVKLLTVAPKLLAAR